MRTTVTLEDDLYVQLEKQLAARETTFKTAINEAVRQWLNPDGGSSQPVERRRTKTYDLGQSSVTNMDNVAELIAMVEGDDYK